MQNSRRAAAVLAAVTVAAGTGFALGDAHNAAGSPAAKITIQRLAKKLATLQSRMATLANNVTTLNTGLNTTNGNVTTLTNRLVSDEGDALVLRTRVDSIHSALYWICTTGNGYDQLVTNVSFTTQTFTTVSCPSF